MIEAVNIAFAVPIIIAIVSALKIAGMWSRWAPFVSILAGVFFMVFFGMGDIKALILNGLVAGLTASGLYSGVKAQTK